MKDIKSELLRAQLFKLIQPFRSFLVVQDSQTSFSITFISLLKMSFQLQSLFSMEWGNVVIMNGKKKEIW